MSTQPIVIEIVDKIDSTIAGKIKAIGLAARQASNDLVNLNAALGNVSGGTTKLSTALQNVNNALKNPIDNASRLERGFANLLGRTVGMELGLGRLGGAFSSLGVAAAGAGPLIIAALAVGSIVGAVIVYDKLYAISQQLVGAQTDLSNHFADQNDKLLVLKETYVGLTDGPLAKYALELADINKKAGSVNFDAISKQLDIQNSKWLTAIAYIQDYYQAIFSTFDVGTKQAIKPIDFDVAGAQKYIAALKEQIAVARDAGNGYQGLQDALAKTGQELNRWHDAEKGETDAQVQQTEAGRIAIQNVYREIRSDIDIANAERKNLQVQADDESLAQQKKFAAEQLQQWTLQLDAYKAQNGKITAQEELGFRQSQQAGLPINGIQGPNLPTLPLNQAAALDITNKLNLSILKQGEEFQDIISKYQATAAATNLYTESQKAAAETNKLLQEAQQRGIQLTQNQVVALDAVTAASTKQIGDQKAALELRNYNITLQSQIDLLGKYGTALTVATEIESIQRTLAKDNRTLTQQQIADYTAILTKKEQDKEVQSALNNIWAAGVGEQEKLVAQAIALDKAFADNIITLGKYKQGVLQTQIAQNNLFNAQGLGTFRTAFREMLSELVDTSKNTLQKMTQIWGQFFNSLKTGIGDSIGQAIVGTEDLKTALEDVARNAVAQLISSFVQLAIEMVIIKGLESIFPQLKTIFDAGNKDTTKTSLANTAAAVAGVATVAAVELAAISALTAPAWSLAEAVSLWSFGANAGAAVAGIAAVVAAGEAASITGKGLNAGGWVTGPDGYDRVPANLTNGEFVVNARDAARNAGLLESLNSGASGVKAAGGSSRTVGNKININISHDGSTRIHAQVIDENTIRIIAKQESRAAVQTFAPGVVASDMQNPNSRTSKAMASSYKAPRKR